ncbi:MAG: hypothetical protein ABIH23_24340 [bacterium]
MVDLQGGPRAIYEEDVILDRAGRGLGTVLQPAPTAPDGLILAVELTVLFPENGTYNVYFPR